MRQSIKSPPAIGPVFRFRDFGDLLQISVISVDQR
jgi:hypothetical protein